MLWGADLLARKQKYGTLDSYRRMLIPLMPVTLIVLALIEKEHDLGTMLVVLTIVLALLWVIGAPLRLFAVIVSMVIAGVTYLALSEPYRLQRLLDFTHPCIKDLPERRLAGVPGHLLARVWRLVGRRPRQQPGEVGVPAEAHSDFIFAIIGEELGLVGTLAVLLLFAVLAYGGIRVAQRSRDTFSRLAASAIVAWLLVQALVNIGAVVGLLPITGIPLPLMSAGGSALIPTMFALGVLMSLARREPSAAAALRARGPNVPRRAVRRVGSVLHLSASDRPVGHVRAVPSDRVLAPPAWRSVRSCTSCLLAGAPPATSSPRSRSPMPCVVAIPPSVSPCSAPRAAWRTGSYPRAGTTSR